MVLDLKMVDREFDYDIAKKLMKDNWSLGSVITEDGHVVKKIEQLTKDAIIVKYYEHDTEIRDIYMIDGSGAPLGRPCDDRRRLHMTYANFLDFKKGDYIVCNSIYPSIAHIIGEYTGEYTFRDLFGTAGFLGLGEGYAIKLHSVWRVYETTEGLYAYPMTNDSETDCRYMAAHVATIADDEFAAMYRTNINKRLFNVKRR